jgi:hypothetical protein
MPAVNKIFQFNCCPRPWFHNVTKSTKRKEGSFLIIHSLHYLGIMDKEEVEQLSKLNRKVFNGEPLTEDQISLRHELTALRAQQPGNLISRYLYIYIYEPADDLKLFHNDLKLFLCISHFSIALSALKYCGVVDLIQTFAVVFEK